jgi:hypothetical protein
MAIASSKSMRLSEQTKAPRESRAFTMAQCRVAIRGLRRLSRLFTGLAQSAERTSAARR